MLFLPLWYSIRMKNALKSKKVWIIASILTVVGVGVPFLVLLITYLSNTAKLANYTVILGLFAACYLLIGYVWGDLHTVAYRRKNKEWDSPLPENIKTSAWQRRWPFFLACIVVFIVFMVFEIIYWTTGSYPIIGK